MATLTDNLAHDTSRTPLPHPSATAPRRAPSRRPGSTYPGPSSIDVIRSLDNAQYAASMSRGFANGQKARATRKGQQVSYTKEQKAVRKELKAAAKSGSRHAAVPSAAKAALKAMPKPEAGQRAWNSWAERYGQRVAPPTAPVATPAAPTVMSRVSAGVSAGQSAMARYNPAMALAAGGYAATAAYNAVRDAGGSQGRAVAAGATAAAPLAAVAAAPSIIGRYAPAAVGTLSRLALPLTIATGIVGAARGGYAAYQDGKGAGAIAREAGLGAADALTFDLASKAFHAAGGDPTSLSIVNHARQQENAKAWAGTPPATSASAAPATPTAATTPPPAMAHRFAAADAAFIAKAAKQPAAPATADPSGRKRGWGPEARIAAAQARGVKKIPYDGNPTAAPGYVAPKKEATP